MLSNPNCPTCGWPPQAHHGRSCPRSTAEANARLVENFGFERLNPMPQQLLDIRGVAVRKHRGPGYESVTVVYTRADGSRFTTIANPQPGCPVHLRVQGCVAEIAEEPRVLQMPTLRGRMPAPPVEAYPMAAE